MWIHGNAAAIVGDGQPVADAKHDFDACGMARNCLVHAVVEDLGREVVQRPFVGAADIHARPTPDRLQPLEDLDRRSIITARFRTGGKVAAEQVFTHASRYRRSGVSGATAERASVVEMFPVERRASLVEGKFALKAGALLS